MTFVRSFAVRKSPNLAHCANDRRLAPPQSVLLKRSGLIPSESFLRPRCEMAILGFLCVAFFDTNIDSRSNLSRFLHQQPQFVVFFY